MTRRGLRGVEDHVRGAEALRPGTRAVARPQAAAAAAEREAWLRGKVEASVFARVYVYVYVYVYVSVSVSVYVYVYVCVCYRTLRMVAWAACGECCRPRAGRRDRDSRTGC